jgi:hypothetical protein
MTGHVRLGGAVVAGLVAIVVATPAQAGSVTTDNACLYSYNGEYRNQLVTLGGTGSPNGATAGTVATLSGASVSAMLPPSLPEAGYGIGAFHAGVNPIPAKVWVAIAASNATPAVQVRELSVTTSTTIADDSNGFVSGTPIVVTIPIPDTTWTVNETGPVAFSQAGPGTLPSLPIGVNDKVQPSIGSIVVKPDIGFRFILDCQPGSTAAPFTSVTPGIASPFATLDAAAPVPPVPPPPPPVLVAPPKPNIATTKLKVAGNRISVKITCPSGTLACGGKLHVRSVAPLKIGKSRRILLVAPVASYDVKAGGRKTLRLRLGSAARTLLRTRRSIRVRVTLKPSSGRAVKRDVTLAR